MRIKIRWDNIIIGLVIGAMSAGMGIWGASIAFDRAEHRLPACQTEDSDNCYWDADTMGNGQGHDSVVIGERSARPGHHAHTPVLLPESR